jgi:hypothetical protein
MSFTSRRSIGALPEVRIDDVRFEGVRFAILTVHHHTPAGTEESVFPVHGFGRGRVVGVATRAVALHAVAIIPTARILTDVTAQGTRVADLWARDESISLTLLLPSEALRHGTLSGGNGQQRTG